METRCGYQYARGCERDSGGNFHGPSTGHRTPRRVRGYAGRKDPISGQTDSRVPSGPLTSTENACRTCVWCLPILFALPQRPRPGSGMLTGFPFDRRGGHEEHPLLNGVSLSLRSGSLTSHCGSRQTLLHFSLQSSHLNICYYHQDLH